MIWPPCSASCGFGTVPHGVPHRAPRGSALSSPPCPTGFPTVPHGAGCRVPACSLGSVLSGRCGGGNCANRDATRRRHAVAMRLMVQNPHPPRPAPQSSPRRSPPCPTGFPTLLPTALPTVPRSAPHRAPRGSVLCGRCDGGGNCINRGATRRRHAVAMLLMVQNPHPPRAGSMARSTLLPTALPTVPHGVPHSPPHRPPRVGERRPSASRPR